MAPSNRTSSTARAGRARKLAAVLPLPAPSRAGLASAFAQAVDLSEGRQPGHAARVCYVALALSEEVALPAGQRQAVFFASLLHDVGAAPASAELCRLLNLSEEALFASRPGRAVHQIALDLAPLNAPHVVETLQEHLERGAEVARQLGFDDKVQEAIGAHHERWDGHGYPDKLKGDAAPATGRLVAAADLIEALISAESNPLTARRNLVSALADYAGTVLDPALAGRARELVRSDEFWLGLHNEGLPEEIASYCPDGGSEEEPSQADLLAFASVFAGLADVKGEHTAGHSERTAEVAALLADALGFDAPRREMLRIAALLHDVGLLGVPARTIAKPDILSLAEMETMRKHPTYSQMVLEALPGLEEIARWAGAHHERPDGRGYPEMLEDDGVPLEARIIAVADTYVALTSPRPYRKALSQADAKQVLLGGSGTQLDARLVDVLCARLSEPTSSRSAPRRARKR